MDSLDFIRDFWSLWGVGATKFKTRQLPSTSKVNKVYISNDVNKESGVTENKVFSETLCKCVEYQ